MRPVSGAPGGVETRYPCPRCGDFWLRDDFGAGAVKEVLQDDPQKTATLSHWIRTKHESLVKRTPDGQFCRRSIILDEELIESIIQNPRPSLAEQADNFVRWLGDNSQAGGDRVRQSMSAVEAIVGSATSREFLLVFDHLKDQGIITGDRELDKEASPASLTQIKATLSFAGWEHYRELKRATSESRKAFMAMEYNKQPLEDIVESVFRDAVRQTGFDLFVLRDNPVAGLIDNRLRAEIRAARFLIADLTHKNPGAYWEAGFAEGLDKPVIYYTCEKKVFEDSECKPHFDTNHHQTILWDSDKREDIAKDLKATIRATLPAEARLTDD